MVAKFGYLQTHHINNFLKYVNKIIYNTNVMIAGKAIINAMKITYGIKK